MTFDKDALKATIRELIRDELKNQTVPAAQLDLPLETPTSEPTAPTEAVEASAPKRRGRPKKEETITAEPEVPVFTRAVNAEVDKDLALQALRTVSDSKGMVTAKNILSKFNATRFSEISPKDYGNLVKECQI